MGAVFDHLRDDHLAFIAAQPMFFVASAPSGPDGHVNLSPKGGDSFRVLDPTTVAYLDFTGSGAETIAHLRDNGRLTIMFNSYGAKPLILRLFGRGEVLLAGSGAFDTLEVDPPFPTSPGVRSIIRLAVERVQTSCGYGVPIMELVGQRPTMPEWAERQGPDGIVEYQGKKNQRSIDGLPALEGFAMTPFAARFDRVRAAMAERGTEALLLSVGPDLPWLCGYEAMPLERLTMLVVTPDAASLVVPELEAPRVTEHPDLFTIRPWGETEDPIAITADLLGSARRVAVGDRTWARFLVELQVLVPDLRAGRSNDVCGPLREVKDPHEIAALHRAGDAVDRIAAELQGGAIPLVGRTEAEVSADLGQRILAEGHHRVNFAIVAAGPNAASPHHEPGSRVIEAGEVVLCDFGGTLLDEFGVGYCSDITRCVWTGDPGAEATEVYDVLHAAHGAAMDQVALGESCESVDRAARDVITAAGWGDRFIHRTGHGMGVEEHEDPYIVEGNTAPLRDGHCFSIEPGIYLPDRFGFRLEDCVIATGAGVDPLTSVDHSLVAVDA